MRIAEVIGTVTLSRAHPALARARWIIAVPFSLNALGHNLVPDGEDVVIFDSLGAGNGHRIGFSEGGEAAVPFLPERKPVDAYCACILDRITIHDRLGGGDHETIQPVRDR
jgi:ethanolamine utilization protein EutN